MIVCVLRRKGSACQRVVRTYLFSLFSRTSLPLLAPSACNPASDWQSQIESLPTGVRRHRTHLPQQVDGIRSATGAHTPFASPASFCWPACGCRCLRFLFSAGEVLFRLLS